MRWDDMDEIYPEITKEMFSYNCRKIHHLDPHMLDTLSSEELEELMARESDI